MNPTINPNANFFSQGQGGNPLPPINTSSTTVNPNMVGTQPLTIAPTTQVPIPNINNLISPDALQSPVVPVAPQTNAQTWTDKLTGLFGQAQGKDVAKASAVDNATAPYNQQLNEINTQIKMLQANSIANQEAAMRSGETSGFASREAQNVARTDAIKALELSAKQAGLQGYIALAESHAEKAVDAQFAQITQDQQSARQNIVNNYESFTPAEKKRADAALLQLDAKDAFVAQQKEDKFKKIIGSASSGYYTVDAQGNISSLGVKNPVKPTTVKYPNGTTISGALKYTPDDAAEDSKALEASRTAGPEADGNYVDPSLYQKLYTAWISNGGLLKDFLSKYPPVKYVNPANKWLPSFLMPAKSGASTTKSTELIPVRPR